MNKAEEILPYEDDECYALVEYMRFKGLFFTHIPNESKVPISYRVKLKRKGLTAGTPDYMILLRADQNKLNRALLVFIEMKRAKYAYPSEAQKVWLEKLNLVKNVEAVVCNGFDKAKEYLDQLLK